MRDWKRGYMRGVTTTAGAIWGSLALARGDWWTLAFVVFMAWGVDRIAVYLIGPVAERRAERELREWREHLAGAADRYRSYVHDGRMQPKGKR